MEERESFLDAAVREIYEETNLKISYENIIFVRQWEIEAHYTSHERIDRLQVQVFTSSIPDDAILMPQDDIDGFMRLNHEAF